MDENISDIKLLFEYELDKIFVCDFFIVIIFSGVTVKLLLKQLMSLNFYFQILSTIRVNNGQPWSIVF